MLVIIVVCICVIISLIYYLIQRNYSYWKRIGIPYIKPEFPYGNLKGIGLKYSFCELTEIQYKEKKGQGPFVGIYFFLNRVAIALDIEFIKNILARDFDTFYDRGFYHNERDDPLSAHLFAIEGPKWKQLRAKSTSTFTSGKMKFMFSTVIEIGHRLQQRLDEIIEADAADGQHELQKPRPAVIVELRDILTRYTMDVIGSCAFGIECNTLNNENINFRMVGTRVFDKPMRSMTMQLLIGQFRDLARFFHIKHLPPDVTTFFRNVVIETIAYREKFNVKRNDFMTVMMNLKQSKVMNDADDDVDKARITTFTMDEIAAQAFVFFLAGFETSSTLLSFCCYELSVNGSIQERLRQSIKDVLKKYEGEFTYEAMMEMTYLDQVLNETLRKYPPISNITRASVKSYTVPGTQFIIPAGTTIVIPAYAIHRDPEYYPDPDKFDPDRFTEFETNKRDPFTFLPFGEGPRMCIGIRFGMMQARIGLAMILLKYRLHLSDKMSSNGIEFTKSHVFISIKGGLWLKLEKLSADNK